MAPSSGEDYSLQDPHLIDLDDFIKIPLFQNVQKQDDGCIIDVGNVDARSPAEVNMSPQEYSKYRATSSNYCGFNNRNIYSASPPERRCAGDRRRSNDYSATYDRRPEGCRTSYGSESTYTFQDSAISRGDRKLDSGVFDADPYRRHNRACRSDVGGREERGGGCRARSCRTSNDVAGDHLDTLKQRQLEDRIDHLTALMEESLQPRPAPRQPRRQRKTSQSKDSSTTELSSSLSEDASHKRRQDKRKKKAAIKCKSLKKITKKVEEMQQHYLNMAASRQPKRARVKSSSESKTSDSTVVVSDKAVCTESLKNHKPRTVAARNEARAKLQLPKVSTSGDSAERVRRRRSGKATGYEGLDELDSLVVKRVLQVCTALTNTECDTLRKRSSLDRLNLDENAIHDYNLNDPISFYNRSKRLGATSPRYPQPQSTNLCTLFRAFCSRIRTSDIVSKILCCGDGYSLYSNTKSRT